MLIIIVIMFYQTYVFRILGPAVRTTDHRFQKLLTISSIPMMLALHRAGWMTLTPPLFMIGKKKKYLLTRCFFISVLTYKDRLDKNKKNNTASSHNQDF